MSITINQKQTNWTRQCNPYATEATIEKKEMKAAVKGESIKEVKWTVTAKGLNR